MNMRVAQRQSVSARSACAAALPAVSPVVVAPQRRALCKQVQPATLVAASKGFGASAKPKVVQPKTEPGPPPTPCSCLSGKTYKNCCQPAHTGSKLPSTPEAALRARFSAYIQGNEQYIIDSTHPDYVTTTYADMSAENAKQQWAADVKYGCTKYDYDGLEVKAKAKEAEPFDPETEGFVMFTYRSTLKLADGEEDKRTWKTTNERSLYVRVDNRWLFKDSQWFDYNMDSLLQQPAKPEPSAVKK